MNLEEYFEMLRKMADADKERRAGQVSDLPTTPTNKPKKAPGET